MKISRMVIVYVCTCVACMRMCVHLYSAAADTIARVLEDVHDLLLQMDCYDTSKSMDKFSTRIDTVDQYLHVHN